MSEQLKNAMENLAAVILTEYREQGFERMGCSLPRYVEAVIGKDFAEEMTIRAQLARMQQQ